MCGPPTHSCAGTAGWGLGGRVGVGKPSLGIETQPSSCATTNSNPAPAPPSRSPQRPVKNESEKWSPPGAGAGGGWCLCVRVQPPQPAGLPRHLQSAVQTICAGRLSSNFHNSPGIWEPSLRLRKLRQEQAKSLTQEITGANPDLRQPLVSREGIQAQAPNQAEGCGEGSASPAPDLPEEQRSLHRSLS